MEVSDKHIQEFKKLYKEKYGEDLSDAKAYEEARSLLGFTEILYDSFVRDRRIEKMLEKEPKGFPISRVGSGVYTCMVCHDSASGEDGWWDAYGPKCLVCQEAVDTGALEGWILEDSDNWHTMSEVKRKLDVHPATLRKMIREGEINATLVPSKTGKPHEYLFLVEDNFHLFLPKDFEERNLLLMSSGEFFTERAPEFYKADFKDLKIAYVDTATKKVPDDSYSKKRIARMDELGWNFKVIDIEGFKHYELYSEFEGIDLIYVEGGNTFHLLDQIRKTKFGVLVRTLTRRGVIYAGSSAGAYVACPSIEMSTWADTQNFDRCGITDFRAMCLVPFLIKAHITPEIEKKIQKYIKVSKFDVQILTDEQAILVSDGKVYLID